MPLHPIAVVDQVLAEYRAYLATEFRASDERLRAALEQALADSSFLAQEPFFQAHRPFKQGAAWRELALDPALARAMEARSRSRRAYQHQSAAIQRLLGADTGPVVVTTGTGSGKTECFLLPVIQNAIEDAVRFKQAGLTAILIYPMNALANDQEQRIAQYLADSGHTYVKVARYDRSTKEVERARLRAQPPHILLTNYMMLEYLLVRPADRDALFANHRCRFVVLDEVHTYRGSLGANIALLFRRLGAHLRRARQDWHADDRDDRRRFPELLPIATSATIKSVDETDRSPEEIRRLRDTAVQEFVGRLTGVSGERFLVLGEELAELEIPAEATWAPRPVIDAAPPWNDPDALQRCLAALAGTSTDLPIEALARRAAILWSLGDRLARRPMSISQLVEQICEDVLPRRGADPEAVRREVEAALIAGAALPEGTSGALRLRTHRFIRGGWRFMRCLDPQCGRLYPMGEERCECGSTTAPLYLCRSCGADAYRMASPDPSSSPLEPFTVQSPDDEWMLYDRGRFEADDDSAEQLVVEQMRGRQVLTGSFDPATNMFASDDSLPLRVVLAPARNRCMVCGGMAGSHPILTPVSLGTSAAVRVLAEGLVEGLAEQNRGREEYDGKDRLLIFSDSRQDAAHQARFITYAGRFDRMRRRVVQVLRERPGCEAGFDDLVSALVTRGVENHDNPHTSGIRDAEILKKATRERAAAWEEAPFLDDVSISSTHRASLLSLGLVGVRYEKLETLSAKKGGALAASLGITTGQLAYILRCLLDEMRRRGALSRELLIFNPIHESVPPQLRSADWDRRVRSPAGYPCTDARDPEPLVWMDRSETPNGITHLNAFRRAKTGGRGPGLERRLRRLVDRLNGALPTEAHMLAILKWLFENDYLVARELHGHRKKRRLLQVNADAIRFELPPDPDRFRCSTCNVRMPWALESAPCPECHGTLRRWPAEEFSTNRYVQRILKPDLMPLTAGEHTAQIAGEARINLEDEFKAGPDVSPVNVLACSPTLEMGIDVGGLDAVVMRNIPPRPDNYAQRGGRAGRRSRVGIVLGYARSTPHDGYFFDKPAEMIAGEVPAPVVNIGNRDVVLRHLHAIAFGAAEPGLAGRMGEYLTMQGELQQEPVDTLIKAVEDRFPHAVELALEAWGPEILGAAGLGTEAALRQALEVLPAKIRDLFDRVRRQILNLQATIDRWNEKGQGDRTAIHAQSLKRRLLGIRSERDDGDADDRGSGHPMRRFAEFGILPGYEFPSEPSTLRLLGDKDEQEPINVHRRFGISQYQPEAIVHARGHRWKVLGLDLGSPWNPKSQDADWTYTVCKRCQLRFSHDAPACPRCGAPDPLAPDGIPACEYGGFLASRDDTPVLQEEERRAAANLVEGYPQRGGRVVARYQLPTDWQAVVTEEETICWLNESKELSTAEQKRGAPSLHSHLRGFYLCPACGRTLTLPDEVKDKGSEKDKGRKKPRKSSGPDLYGHFDDCTRKGSPPDLRHLTDVALMARTPATTLRINVVLPVDMTEGDYERWGYSLGYALRTGLRQLYMLDGPEIEFLLEPTWESRDHGRKFRVGALTFIDAAVGGSGFLGRAAAELHLVARRAIEHLDHPRCESACYRCLKSYTNQRHHMHLSWPDIMPDLEALADRAPDLVAEEPGDRDDPRPWLEAYDAGVGSPLEFQFLRLFQEQGIDVEKQVQIRLDEAGPVVSTADFRVRGTTTLIYVDGAAFHRGPRLRRDRAIRRRLEAAGWRIVSLTAQDLGNSLAVKKISRIL